jgi:alkanesulfonate monooxygenase SsuD/methylene tetrahydromethanopterin reductase-like flavin-dependent oxidoreductase (luciferase family)/predicted kinase
MDVIPVPSLVWLVGPAGAGKTTWAGERFAPNETVSSDALRAATGSGEHDLDASGDAFAALELIASARLRRRMTTVIDTLGFDDELRRRMAELAREAGLPVAAVVFETPEPLCRSRNASRDRSVPAKILTGQFRRARAVRDSLEAEGWPIVVASEATEVEPDHALGTAQARRRQAEAVRPLEFFLHVSRFDWVDRHELGESLGDLARTADQAGFAGFSVMDHLVQIPQVGRGWDPMPEALVTLAHLSGATDRLRLSPLVTNVALRHPALLGKMIATLDVLSGGRAECGLGAGWYETEHSGFGIPFPPASERLDLLEDTLRLFPLLWGPGSPSFEGRRITVPSTVCYPRPIQERLRIVIGGRGDRTMRLAAELADGWNLSSSDPELIESKLGDLSRHCEAIGRDPADVDMSVLDVTVCASSRVEVSSTLERVRGNRSSAEVARRLRAGTVEDHIGRYRQMVDLGVRRVYVGLADIDGPGAVDRFAPVVEAFSA